MPVVLCSLVVTVAVGVVFVRFKVVLIRIMSFVMQSSAEASHPGPDAEAFGCSYHQGPGEEGSGFECLGGYRYLAQGTVVRAMVS